MNGACLHLTGALAESPFETKGDLAGGFVGERERAESLGLKGEALDQETDSFDETEGLAGAGAGEDEERFCRRLDRVALSVGRRGEGDRRQLRLVGRT